MSDAAVSAFVDLKSLYPPIEPYAQGQIDVGDGHSVHLWPMFLGPPGLRSFRCHERNGQVAAQRPGDLFE